MKKQTKFERYEKNTRIKKTVSFHICNDNALIEYANSLNFSVWVKQKLKEEMENGMKKSELSLEFGTHGNVAKAFRENKSDEIVMYLCENNIESITVWSNGRNFIHIHKDGLFSVKEFIDNHIGIITHASGLSWSDACNF